MKAIPELGFLVVEDHRFQKWHCCNVLRDLGAQRIYSAENGPGALELLGFPGTTIDVVLADLDVPGMDGTAFLGALAEKHPGASLVLVSTPERAFRRSVEEIVRAYGVRLLGTMEKPVTRRGLDAMLALRGEARAAIETPAEYSASEIADGLAAGQFETFFQPKVEMRSCALKGAEALARWHHPRNGLLAAKAFMPALEAAGLVDGLTWRVAGSAIENCRAWRDAGLDLTVAINVPVSSLEQLSFADRIVQLVTGGGLDPAHVVLEITESAAARDLGRKLETLARLREKGFGLSIDDYGTGYSSMQRLRRIAFTELKIDEAFVLAAPTDPSSRALVESSLQVAARLGIGAVGEGVETQAQWDLLAELGCPVAQGHHIAGAMEGPAFLEWSLKGERICA